MGRPRHTASAAALVTGAALLLLPARAPAQVPRTMIHQGRLLDAAGAPARGTVEVVWRIYDAAAGGTALWTQRSSVTLDDGYFSAALGDGAPLPETLFNGGARFLGVTVGADSEMTPREPIGSVPYALVAGNAVGHITPTSITVGGTTIVDAAGRWTGPATGLAGPMGPAGPAGPVGPAGPMGPAGPAGSPDTPAQVLAKHNQAVIAGGTVSVGAISYTEGRFDLRWAMQHAAASGACAAAAPVGGSCCERITVPRRGGQTCTATCAAVASHPSCLTSIAIGAIRVERAVSHTERVGSNYNYGCGDSQDAYDEVRGEGLDSSYTAYCCCFR